MLRLNRLEQHHLFQGTSLGLMLAIILTLGLGISQWHNDWQLSHHPKKASQPSTQPTVKLQASALSQTHLFGQSPSGDVPISNLQLHLSGIVTANQQNTRESKAYISVSGEASKIYHTGDLLPYGVKIYAIQQNAVILSKEGQFEKLPLPRQSLQFKSRESKGVS